MKEFVKWLFVSASAWATYAGLLLLMVNADLPDAAIVPFLIPFFLFALAITFLNPGKRAIQRFIPDGKIKRLLLTRIN